MFKNQILCYFLLAAIGCSRGPTATEALDPQKKWDQKIRTFSSCKELDSYIQTNEAIRRKWSWDPVPIAASQHYVNQTENVLEGDILQSNEIHFFFIRSGSIEIIDRRSLKQIKSIPVPLHSKQRLILTDGQLTYIAQSLDTTIVKVFELQDFHLSFEKTLEGTPLEFRVINDQLITVGQKSLPPAAGFSNCTNVYYPNLTDFGQDFTFVHIVSLKNEKPVNSIALAGSTHGLFMTNDEIFLFTNSPTADWFWGGHERPYLPSHFRVVQWQSGELKLSGVTVYEGTLKDRWSVSQSKENLFLASSSQDSEFKKFNNIQVFQRENMTYQLRSVSEKFGLNEDIRAVSYQAGKAYVVTFQKTDPLYVIDLTDVDQLKILAEIKAPGFSTQLRQLSEGIWAGLGFQASPQGDFSWFGGLQFSIFNLRDLTRPFEASRLEWGSRGSSSEATFESKALFSTKGQDRMMFPIVALKKEANPPPWDVAREHEFSGAIILDIQKDQMKEAGRVSHREWREKYCGRDYYLSLSWWNLEQVSADIQRIIQSEQGIYTFSRFGVMKMDSSTFQEQSRLEFENTKDLCLKLL